MQKKFYATDRAHKRDRHMVIKILSFWCQDCVVLLLLDADADIGDNVHASEAADFSL